MAGKELDVFEVREIIRRGKSGDSILTQPANPKVL